MNSKAFWWAVRMIVVLVLAVATGAPAQIPTPVHFAGLINDYSPLTVKPTGPWEIRGQWTLTLEGVSGTADFSAALTMVRSDYWVSQNLGDLDTPSARSPHTHHITLAGGVVTPIMGGFRVSGPATVLVNGSPASFSPSTLVIDITGGTSVAYSNITLTFEDGATGHFGSQAIHGVVASSE
jgi:hypothetical protein